MSKKTFRDYSEIGQWAIPTLCVEKTEEVLRNAESKGDIQVEIKINGVEVDFENILNSLNGQFKDAVKKEAKNHISQIVSGKLSEIMDVLYNIENQADCLQEDLENIVGF